jgi:alkyl hydroperoxide reductase subunit AhpC
VSKAYGILDEERQFARRTTFVIDKEGIVRHIEQGSVALSPAGALDACSILHGKK